MSALGSDPQEDPATQSATASRMSTARRPKRAPNDNQRGFRISEGLITRQPSTVEILRPEQLAWLARNVRPAGSVGLGHGATAWSGGGGCPEFHRRLAHNILKPLGWGPWWKRIAGTLPLNRELGDHLASQHQRAVPLMLAHRFHLQPSPADSTPFSQQADRAVRAGSPAPG